MMNRISALTKRVNKRNLKKAVGKLNPRAMVDAHRNRIHQDRPRNHVLCHYTSCFYPEVLIQSATLSGQVAEPGFVTNFIGVRIRPQVMPSVLAKMEGTVEGPPAPGNWHADIAEWGAVFRVVDKAGKIFRMMELGCGWGCWMVNSGAYARRMGKKVELIGIEADADHLSNAETTLRDNGFAPGDYRLVNGVAGPRNGVALFPKLEAPGEDWGGEAVFYPPDDERERLLATGRYTELECHTLSDLCGGAMLDLLHIDIQGAEVDYIIGNFEDISRLVRRVLIGTHSRAIEGQLTQFFLDHGWMLEMDRPAISEISGGRPVIRIDGVHMWRNPAL